MKIFDEIRNRITKKERREIELLKKKASCYEDEAVKYFAIILDNRIAIHQTVSDLVKRGVFSEEDSRLFYELLDGKYGYIRNGREVD